MLRLLTIALVLLNAQSAHAIVRGIAVEPRSNALARHVVALQVAERQPDGSTVYHKGSAVIISDDLLLTAGHVVAYVSDLKDITAIFSSTPCWGVNSCGETRIAVRKAIAHPKFRQISGGTEFDLALVKLATKIPSGYFPISVVGNDGTATAQFPFHVFGYGTDREDANPPTTVFRLRRIDLAFEDPSWFLGKEQKFWVSQTSGGICNGDSGGPAIVEEGGIEKVAGIAIHVTYEGGTFHCFTKGAFTDVKFFSSWIRDTLSRLSVEQN